RPAAAGCRLRLHGRWRKDFSTARAGRWLDARPRDGAGDVSRRPLPGEHQEQRASGGRRAGRLLGRTRADRRSTRDRLWGRAADHASARAAARPRNLDARPGEAMPAALRAAWMVWLRPKVMPPEHGVCARGSGLADLGLAKSLPCADAISGQ